MIFYILLGIIYFIVLSTVPILFYHRREPCIALRDFPLSLLSNVFFLFWLTVYSVIFERYYSGAEWVSLCSLLTWVFDICNPMVILAIILRAYNFQFKFHSYKNKITDENDPFFEKCSFTSQIKWNFLFMGIAFVVLIIPTIVVSAVIPIDYTSLQTLSQCYSIHVYIYLFQATPNFIALTYLVYKYRVLRDPYYVKLEYTLLVFLGSPLVGVMVITQLVDTAMTHQTFLNVKYQPILLVYVIALVFVCVTIATPLTSLYLEKKNAKMLKERRRSSEEPFGVKNIFESPFLTREFLKVTLDNWCVEQALFAMAIEKFVHYPEEQLSTQAKVIFKKFIERGAEMEINIDQPTYLAIVQKIEKGPINRNIFSSALRDVLAQLEGVLMRWKIQPEYKQIMESYQEESLKEKMEMLEIDAL